MAHREQAPFKAQDVGEISRLLEALESHQKKGKAKGGFSVKKSTFTLRTGRTVDSWKMMDWDYKKENLPTYARGLFTIRNNKNQPEIAVRGYDKFFNHGEVRKTEWRNVETHTRGPYELSVKENGCIIFIAGLDDGTLIVCSKHSTGDRGEAELSHAIAGERWVDRQLKEVGKTREQFAAELRRRNVTAVAELCDDAFEEHVLAYNPESAGLYLHGVNLNLPEFATYPGQFVDEFATDWGFKKTVYVMEDDITKVKTFLDHVAETGAYNGRETEGFVIRCQARETDATPWHDWFFKYKFDEPYLMYRQWRECTKAIIAGRAPRIRKHKKITEEYLHYARRRLASDPGLGKRYNANHGIIALRDDFLQEKGVKGSDVIRQEIQNGSEVHDVTRDIVLVPVATIGCGKTTVAVALTKLFGWGHFQNDNIEGKQRRPQRFAQAICDLLAAHPVVIADRNNHQKRERAQIIDDIRAVVSNAHFVAIQYVHDHPNYDRIRKATQDRVLSRGDNHQTIQAGSKSQEEIIGIMEGFLHRFQPVDIDSSPDDGFDLVVDLDVTASSRENLEVVVAKLNSEYPKLFSDMPSGSDLDEAIEAALNDYKPDVKHDLSFGKNPQKRTHQQRQSQQTGDANDGPSKPKPLEYFAVKLTASRLNSILEAVFRDQDAETARFYRQLSQSRRVQPEFHVTLIHRASSSQHPEQWQRLSDMHETKFQEAMSKRTGPMIPEPELGTCKVQLERLVWDDRVMCFVVRVLPDEDGQQQFETVNKTAHVTVGTASPTVKPKESNDLLQHWLQGGSGGETGLREVMVKGHVVLDGSVRGVLQRFGRTS